MAVDKRSLEEVYNCFEDAICAFWADYANDILVGKVDLEEAYRCLEEAVHLFRENFANDIILVDKKSLEKAYMCLADTIQALEQHLVSDVLSVKAFTDKKKSDIALHWCRVREWYTVLSAKLQKDEFSINPVFDDTPQIIIKYAKNEMPE